MLGVVTFLSDAVVTLAMSQYLVTHLSTWPCVWYFQAYISAADVGPPPVLLFGSDSLVVCAVLCWVLARKGAIISRFSCTRDTGGASFVLSAP